MTTAAVWGVAGLFWCSVFFILVVSIFWRWWRSPLGRAMVSIDACLVISFGPATFDVLFGWPDESSTPWQWEAICGFMVCALLVLWKTWVIFRVQAGPGDKVLTNAEALHKLTSGFSWRGLSEQRKRTG